MKTVSNLLLVTLALVLGYGSLTSLAQANELQLTLPKARTLQLGQGVSWLLRSTSGHSTPPAAAPAVFLLAGPASAHFKRLSENLHQLNWTPQEPDLGRHQFRFMLEDAYDRAITHEQAFHIDVVPAAPVKALRIVTGTEHEVTAGELLEFRVATESATNHDTALQIQQLPETARFDLNEDGSRSFRWRPTTDDQGRHTLTFVATDLTDPLVSESIDVRVDVVLDGVDLNAESDADKTASAVGASGASIEPLPERVVTAGQPMSQLIRAQFDERHAEVIAERLPDGATLSSDIGGERVFRWQPNTTQTGFYTVRFSVRDRETQASLTDTELQIRVRTADSLQHNRPPVLHVSGPDSVAIGEELVLDITATDPDGQIPILMAGAVPPSARFVPKQEGQRQFIWTPAATDQGIHVLQFWAQDRQVPDLEVTQKVRIVVGPAR